MLAADSSFRGDARKRWDDGAAVYDARHVRSRSRWFGPVERRMYRSLLPPAPAGRRLRVLGLGAVYAFCQPRRGLHQLYHRLGWATMPIEYLLQRGLGLLARAGAYLVVVARKAPAP